MRMLTAAVLTVGLAGNAFGQAYPARPVTLVVPFAAGGPSDALARILAQKMGEALGQSVVIENVPGAGGTIGSGRVVRSEPDGYTVLINDLALPSAPLLNAQLPFDVRTDLEPVGLINAGPMVLIARPRLAGPTAQALFAHLRAQGDAISLGHSGTGSNSQMCGLLVQQALGVTFTEVAYRGAGPAMNDLLGGSIDLMCEQSTTAIPQIRAGRVIPYGVTSRMRLANLPDVPTLDEAGLSGFDFTVWHGLYVPRGTPADRIARLNAALRQVLEDADTRERYAQAGRTEFPESERTPAAHRARFDGEIERLRALLATPPRATRTAN